MEILTNSATVVGAETITGLGSWQHQMKTAIRDLAGLRKMLGLPEDSNASTAESVFSVFAPLAFVGRIERGNAADPLLLQLLPRSLEDTSPDHFSVDPLLESNAKLGTGVLKKYAHRALMIVTGACAIHCRYCFRRQFPYQDHTAIADDWKDAVDAIAVDSTIHEVILSGGDPLTVVDARLESLVDRIAEIQHVRRLRIHTRLPIMIPSRVTDALVGMLSRTRLEVVVVIHSNHAREIDGDVAEAMKRLTSAGAILLNQSVLLAGVNDDAGTLIQLSNRLLATGVLPYYLHQLDQVIGTSHFEVPVAQGIAIVEEMRTLLPGFAVPRYVQEISGRLSKTVLA